MLGNVTGIRNHKAYSLQGAGVIKQSSILENIHPGYLAKKQSCLQSIQCQREMVALQQGCSITTIVAAVTPTTEISGGLGAQWGVALWLIFGAPVGCMQECFPFTGSPHRQNLSTVNDVKRNNRNKQRILIFMKQHFRSAY